MHFLSLVECWIGRRSYEWTIQHVSSSQFRFHMHLVRNLLNNGFHRFTHKNSCLKFEHSGMFEWASELTVKWTRRVRWNSLFNFSLEKIFKCKSAIESENYCGKLEKFDVVDIFLKFPLFSRINKNIFLDCFHLSEKTKKLFLQFRAFFAPNDKKFLLSKAKREVFPEK